MAGNLKARSGMSAGTTELGYNTKPGYKNRNGQTVLRPTNRPGTDHNQRVYVLEYGSCGHQYGANGWDIWERRCPCCGGGRPGLDIGEE